MLREVFETTGLEPAKAAALLGLSPELFQEWLADQREVPASVLSLLSNVIGLELKPYLQRKVPLQEAAAITPAIWYRFRGEGLVIEDREFVLLVRRLGYFINELEGITNAKAVGWRSLFQDIRQKIDIQAPPRVQGIQAADMFRESRGLSVGATGIGDVLRGNLRSMGVLVIETPIPKSNLEGCCFYVGSRPDERPCVFANTHHTTWFRRNEILLHEIAHGIFDAESCGATLDFFEDVRALLIEERADAFAQQVLAPRQVIQHIAQKRGIKWSNLSADGLATLVADTHAEKRLILRSALESALISKEQHDTYKDFDIASTLHTLSPHALTTDEYLRTCGEESDLWVGKRNTTYPGTSLRLPSAYADAVVRAFRDGEISRGKASEMLMIDDSDFRERFEAEEEYAAE